MVLSRCFLLHYNVLVELCVVRRERTKYQRSRLRGDNIASMTLSVGDLSHTDENNCESRSLRKYKTVIRVINLYTPPGCRKTDRHQSIISRANERNEIVYNVLIKLNVNSHKSKFRGEQNTQTIN